MTDYERFQLADTFHQELKEARVPHIVCVEMSSGKGTTGACAGSWQSVIKMMGVIIGIYSKQLGVSKRDIFKALAVALGGKEKMKDVD